MDCHYLLHYLVVYQFCFSILVLNVASSKNDGYFSELDSALITNLECKNTSAESDSQCALGCLDLAECAGFYFSSDSCFLCQRVCSAPQVNQSMLISKERMAASYNESAGIALNGMMIRNQTSYHQNDSCFGSVRCTSLVHIRTLPEVNVWVELQLLSPHVICDVEFTLPTLTSIVYGFEYRGCYIEGHPRDLDGLTVYNIGNSATFEYCSELCISGGFQYMGLQFYDECFCDDDYGSYGRAEDADCNTPCLGNNNQTCGGRSRISVWRILAERHSVSVLLSEEKVCAEQSREHSLSLRYRYTCSSRTSNIIRIEAHYSQPTSLQITQLRITGWKLP